MKVPYNVKSLTRFAYVGSHFWLRFDGMARNSTGSGTLVSPSQHKFCSTEWRCNLLARRLRALNPINERLFGAKINLLEKEFSSGMILRPRCINDTLERFGVCHVSSKPGVSSKDLNTAQSPSPEQNHHTQPTYTKLVSKAATIIAQSDPPLRILALPFQFSQPNSHSPYRSTSTSTSPI